MIATAVAVVLAIAIAGAWNPVKKMINDGKREEVIAVLTQPGIDNIRQGLELAKGLGAEQEELLINDERTRNAIVAHIARKDEKSINEALAVIAPYDDKWEQEIRDADAARNAIVNLYEGRILASFDLQNDKFDFVTANEVIIRLDKLYPDSATVLGIRNDLKGEKDRKLI